MPGLEARPEGSGGPEDMGSKLGAQPPAESEAEARMKLREVGIGGEGRKAVNEFLAGHDIDPSEVWISLSHDLLLPSERSCIPPTQWEYSPLLKEALRRAGASSDTQHLEERRQNMELKLRELREEVDRESGLGTKEGRLKAEAIAKKMSTVGERLQGREEEITRQDGSKVTVKTREGLVDRLNQRIAAETGMDERKEWEQLYWKLRGSITLTEIHVQREKAMSGVETYCEQLFLSGFYKVEIQMSEMLALLEDEEYGLEIEEAMKAYARMHMGEGIKVKFGEFSREFDDILTQELTRRGRKFDRNSQEEIPLFDMDGGRREGTFPPPLWVKDKADILGRELVSAYVKEVAARARGGERYHVAERAEILAKRILEFSLLTVWLSVPRDAQGKIKGKRDAEGKLIDFPKEGFGRLEGGTSCDLAKQILTTSKYWNERDKNKPAGVGYWQWEKVPFEGFSRDMFHMDVKVGVAWYDEELNEITPKDRDLQKRREIPIFDLWLGGKDGDRLLRPGGYRLAEIFRGINSGPSSPQEIVVLAEEGGRWIDKKVKASRVERTEVFSQNWFDSYHFVVYKQHRAKEMALLSGREGKQDCIAPLLSKDALESMTKDIGTAFTTFSDGYAEWYKFNLALTRIMSWYDVAGNANKGDFPLSFPEYKQLGFDKEAGRAAYITKLETSMIYRTIEKSKFLEPASQKLLKALLGFSIKGEEPRMLSYEEFWKMVSDPRVIEGEGFTKEALKRLQTKLAVEIGRMAGRTEEEKTRRVQEVLRNIP